MSFWQFLGSWFKAAFHRSWHAGHIVHQVLVFLFGLLALLSIIFGIGAARGEEPEMLIADPLVGAILVFLAGLVWHAYRLYHEEYDKREALANESTAKQESLSKEASQMRATAESNAIALRESGAEIERLRGQNRRQEADARKLAERLRPVLELHGPGASGGLVYRVTVRNLSDVTVRFRVRLVEARPPVGVVLPAPLAPTYGSSDADAEVHGGGDAPIDLLEDRGPYLALLVAADTGEIQLCKDTRYELRVCVYPAGEESVPTYRWFYVVPQPDKKVILTPG